MDYKGLKLTPGLGHEHNHCALHLVGIPWLIVSTSEGHHWRRDLSTVREKFAASRGMQDNQQVSNDCQMRRVPLRSSFFPHSLKLPSCILERMRVQPPFEHSGVRFLS